MVSKLIKLAALPAGLAITSYGLYALSDRMPQGTHLSTQQLSVYSVPLRGLAFIEEQPGRVEAAVTAVRTTLSPAVAWSRSSLHAVRNGVVEMIQFGNDSYVYLKNPPPEFLPRLGVISVSWLAGLILSRRGSRLKKIVYPVGMTALGVSVCYPAKAVLFAKVTGKKLYNGGQRTYDIVSTLWKTQPVEKEDLRKPPIPENMKPQTPAGGRETRSNQSTDEPIKVEHTEPPVSHEEPIRTETTEPLSSLDPVQLPDTGNDIPEHVSPASVKDPKFTPPPGLSDHGQSSLEDVDLYSTRT